MRSVVLQICCGLALISAISAAILPAQSPPATTSSAKTSSAKSAAVSAENVPGSGIDKPATSKTNKPKAGNPKPGNAKAANSKVLPGITPEREAAVMTFVQRHHPELAELLIHLKENTPKEYDRAVRDLFRTSERLAQVQERDSLAYELELKSWQARSRAQLLAARLQMAESDDLRKQLRATLNEEYDLRLQLLQRDRERVTERMNHLSEQIDKLSQKRDEEIEKQMKQLTSAARGSDVKAKGKPQTKKRAENKTEN